MPKQKPTEAELAQAAMALLNRADIKGSEVGTFVEVHNWLQAKVDHIPQKPEADYDSRN